MRGRAADGFYRTKCHQCGTVLHVATIGACAKRALCKTCEADGAGWRIVFDRAQGIGAIPPNLASQVTKEAQPTDPHESRAELLDRLRRLELQQDGIQSFRPTSAGWRAKWKKRMS